MSLSLNSSQSCAPQRGEDVSHPGEIGSSAEHFVQFYEDEAFLTRSVATFIGGGIGAGEGAVVIATPSHRHAIIQRLTDQGIDVSRVQSGGQLVMLDAQDTLGHFMVDGLPDEQRFMEVLGPIISCTGENRDGLRAFGEMVALLWAAGQGEAAILLEELWNKLGRRHAFRLFCAYPLMDFNGASHSADFSRICHAHSRVEPTEKLAAAASEADRLRIIAELQQRSLSLESEIARREQAEQTLRRREAELTEFVENASVGLHWAGPDGIIQWANKADFEMLGYTAEEFIGHHVAQFHADQKVSEDILARLTRGERLRNYEAQLKCKDGSLKTVLIDSSVLWENGKFVHTQCFTRDITEQKRAEHALRESESRLRQLLSLMPAAVYACDREGRFIFFNKRAVELWQHAPSKNADQHKFCAAYKCWFNGTVLPPDQTPMAVAVREGKSFRNLEPIFERPDGSRINALVSIDPLYDDAGQLAGAINVFQDITPLKLIEQQLRRSESHRRAIIDNTPECVKIVDVDGTLLEMNRAGLCLVEAISPEEALGKCVFSLIAPEWQDAFKAMHERVCKGSAERLEFELIGIKGTRRWMETCAVPFPDEATGRTLHLAITRDIEARKRAAEELEKAVSERTVALKSANSQLEEFSYSVSHDLRAPLRAIEGYSRLLLTDYSDQLGDDANIYIARISRSVSRLQRMVDDLLALSRVTSAEVKVERVRTADLIREILDEQPQLQKPLASVHVLPLEDVKAHPVLLHQALSNLLGNAVKFAKPGVHPEVRIWSEFRRACIRICIQDNGVGVPPELQPKLFGLFQRLHQNQSFEGTGVGLAIVRKCAERMGGSVGVCSNGESGSLFWIELPRP